MPKIEPFEKYYKEYDSWFDDNKIIYQTEINALKKLLPKGKGIEVGIGTGRFAVPLGIKEGIEPSLKMREIAIKRGLKVIDGIAEKISLPNNEYDYVLLVTTLCFLDDINKAFQEIYRILKSKGSLLIGFIDKDSPIGKLYLKNKKNDPFYKHANFYSSGEVIEYLKINGYTDIKIIQTIFGSLDQIKKIQKPKSGYSEGSFVVIKAKRM